VVALSGGTGGAKLARGLLDVVGPQRLTVIANTADDIEIYGAHVSPDPDLVSFWLADRIDPRGWGLAGDSFCVMDGLRELGVEVWFNLGDRDLAWCIERRRLEECGHSPSEAHLELCRRIGLQARVVPMADLPFRTFVNGKPLQEFLIQSAGEQPRTVELRASGGAKAPPPSPAAAEALAGAEVVVIGPSNPVISIWPILEVVGGELRRCKAPLVVVMPFVRGQVLKGPTDRFLTAAGHSPDPAGALAYYTDLLGGRIDGVVSDEPLETGLPQLAVDTLLDTPERRRAVAEAVVRFGLALRR